MQEAGAEAGRAGAGHRAARASTMGVVMVSVLYSTSPART